jgi:hypothetical protein
MATIIERVEDVRRRIADTEARIADLKRTRSAAAMMLMETTFAVLAELQAYKARLERAN